MDRMFIDPESGEMHDERWFRMQNIDLDTVIEAVEMDGNLGFVIIPQNISRMRVRDSTVIGLIAHFTEAMLLRMDETDDEDERELLREAGQTICAAMMHHLSDAEREDNNGNLH